MVHEFVDTSAERLSLFLLFLLPKSPFGFMDKYFLRKVEIRMKIKYQRKRNLRFRTVGIPQVRQPCKPYKEEVNRKKHQRQKIPYRIVRRGC